MLNDREVGRGVVGSQPGFIVAEDHVHDPMEAVLDGPVAADDRPQQVGRQDQRCDVEACLLLDLFCGFPDAFGDD